MFQKATAKVTAGPGHRLVAKDGHETKATETEALAPVEQGFGGFEIFGRSGLGLDGLHRDQQWVGAWGGRC